jgi:protein arginine kinase activator
MCGEEGAVIHLLRVQDGAVTHTRLCHSCAESLAGQTEGISLVLAVPAALRQIAGAASRDEPAAPAQPQEENRVCTLCGTTLADLKESGTVGCAVCYQVFAEQLAAAVQDGVDPVEHLGKIPHRAPASDTLRHEVIRLKRMLSELVETERFEEAAGVRDRLADLARDQQEDGR